MQKKSRGLAAVLLFVLFFGLGGCSHKSGVYETGLETEWYSLTEAETMYTETVSEAVVKADAGYVYVCGAVYSPGVYPVHTGMRIFEAIELAGGFLPEADYTWEAKARAVVEYRKEHGAFSSIEEIRQISGIKQAVFSKIKDQITV